MKSVGPGADAEDVGAGQEPLRHFANDIVLGFGDVGDPGDRKRGRGESSSPPVAGNFHPICG